jgi:hypothetical protein
LPERRRPFENGNHLHPQRTAADGTDPELRHAIAPIPEHGDRYLRVIYNPNVAPWRVVTAYFDRGLRGE